MNKQVVSVLLCALLCSTFAHDYQRAQHFSEHLHRRALGHKNQQSHLSVRNNEPQDCSWVCTGGSDNGLKIIVNETLNIIGIVNVTANVSFVLDINANLIGLFNGNNGVAIIINIETGAGVYISADTCNSTWLSSSETFEVFFSNLTSLQVILDLHIGVSFNISSASQVILEAAAEIVIYLSSQLAAQIKADVKITLTLIVGIAKSLSILLKGTLKGILQFVGVGLVVIYGDIVWFVNVLTGLGEFLGAISGGLAALIAANIQLNLQILLKAADGFELLTNLLLQIGAHFDLSVILGGILNAPEKFLNLIVLLGGGVSVGITGVFKIVANIISFINGTVNLDVVIQSLLEYSASTKVDINISVAIDGLLNVTSIQNSTYNNSASLQVFVGFFVSIRDGNLTVGGVNISEIITVLIKVSGGALDLVVEILLKLSAIVKAAIAIPQLFLHLIVQLNSTVGVLLVISVVGDIGISAAAISSGNILGSIFKNVNVIALFQGIISFDITKILSNLPVVGKIYIAISNSVNVSSNGSLSLKSLIQGSEQILYQIKVWLVTALHITQKWILVILGIKVDGSGNIIGGTNSTTGSGSVTGSGGGSIGVSGGGSVTVSGGYSFSGGYHIGKRNHAKDRKHVN